MQRSRYAYTLHKQTDRDNACVECNRYDMQPRCRLDQPCNPERAEQVPSRIFSAFQLPTAPPYVWGSLCRFYDYAERGDLNPTGDAPPYVGTWRHMNETFVVVRDLESCPGYSSASSKQQALFEACLTLPSGSSIAVPDAECFAKNSLGSVTDCGFKLVGTTGGCVSVGMHVCTCQSTCLKVSKC